MSDEKGAYVSADDFLNDRREWINVDVVEIAPQSFDVVLTIDGTYTSRGAAEAVAQSFTRDIQALLRDLDPSRFI